MGYFQKTAEASLVNQPPVKTNWRVAIPIILVFVVLLYAYVQINTLVAAVKGPTFMTISPAGELVLQVEQTLYFIDGYENIIKQVDISDLELNKYGEMDFFSDGTVLVYSSKYTPSLFNSTYAPSLSDGVLRFLRMETEVVRAPVDKEGFYRCNLESMTCEKFGNALPLLSSTFRIEIDRETNTVYFSDSGMHTIYKVSAAGEKLATITKELEYPNELLFLNGELWVANTNRMRVSVLDAGENFGSINNEFNEGIGPFMFPTSLEFVNDNLWVGVKTNQAMNNGKIIVQPSNGSYENQSVELPENADPMAIKLFNNRVWVSDMQNKIFYRFSVDGKRLTDFSTGELEVHLNELKALEQSLKSTKRLIEIIGLVIFMCVMGLAIYIEKKKPRKNS